MADKPAATATVIAASAESAPGASPAMSTARPAGATPELMSSPSFDVEDMLAGAAPEPDATETEPEGAETDETTPESDAGDETPAEETSADEAAEEPADEAGDDADAEVLKALKPKAVKRFNQMLKQRDEALAEVRAAKAEKDALQAQLDQRQDEPVPVSVPGDPLAAVTNAEQLEAHEQFYQRVKAWCRRNPNGGTPPKELTGGAEMELMAEQVVNNLELAETMLEAAPKRRAFLETFHAKRAEARTAHPEMFKAGTPEHAAAKGWTEKLLKFRTQADADLIVAKLVKAERMEREEREGVARYTRVELKPGARPAAAAAAKPAPKPAAARTAIPALRTTTGTTTTQAAWDKVNSQGGSVDVEELMGEAA